MPIDHARAIAQAMGISAPPADEGPAPPPPGFSSQGSPGRMAALLLLGNTPEGVPSDALRKAIRTADPRVWDESRMQNVLVQLRATGLAAPERDEYGSVFWFSPPARRVAMLRGTWPPKHWVPRGPVKRERRNTAAADQAGAHA